MYEELKENEYNTANRQMARTLGDWLLDNYSTVGSVSPDQEQYYKDLAQKAQTAAWNDLNREMGKAQAAANARAYNHFGSLTSTPSLYEQESFAREANSNAINLANATAKYYNSLVNQDINRQLQAWQQYSNMYNKAGEDITNFDKYNWNIRNQNKDRAYTNDLQAFNAYKQRMNQWGNIANLGGNLLGSFLGNKMSENADKGMDNMRTQVNNLPSFSMPSSIADKYNYFSNPSSGKSLFGNAKDSLISNINTNNSGWLGNISANLGSSGSSAANTGGSWLSSIGSWFKGLGGK